jgi:hypothetical protein
VSTTFVQILEVVFMAFGGAGGFVAFRTAGAQAKKQRNEGGESYVRASDGAVVTMERIVDQLAEDRDYWRQRALDCEQKTRRPKPPAKEGP